MKDKTKDENQYFIEPVRPNRVDEVDTKQEQQVSSGSSSSSSSSSSSDAKKSKDYKDKHHEDKQHEKAPERKPSKEAQQEKVDNKTKEKEKINEEKSTDGKSLNKEKVDLKPVKKDMLSKPEPKKEVPVLKPVEKKQANKETTHDETVQLKSVEKQANIDVSLKSKSKEAIAKTKEEPAPKSTKIQAVKKEATKPASKQTEPEVQITLESSKIESAAAFEDKRSVEKSNIKNDVKTNESEVTEPVEKKLIGKTKTEERIVTKEKPIDTKSKFATETPKKKVIEKQTEMSIVKDQEYKKKETIRKTDEPIPSKVTIANEIETTEKQDITTRETKHANLAEQSVEDNENIIKKEEPIKKLSHSISREEDKIQVKQTEVKRKTIENSEALQKEVIKQENISALQTDTKEVDGTSPRVRMVKKKKKKAKSDSEIETIQFDQIIDDETDFKQSQSEEMATEQKYTVEEPESPGEPLIENKVRHQDHAQRDIEVLEMSPSGNEQPKSWPTGEKTQGDLIPTIIEPKLKEDDTKIDVQLKRVEQTRKENIPEIRLSEDFDLKPTPKQSPKIPESSSRLPMESIKLKQTKQTTTHDTNTARVEQEDVGEVFDAVENWLTCVGIT